MISGGGVGGAFANCLITFKKHYFSLELNFDRLIYFLIITIGGAGGGGVNCLSLIMIGFGSGNGGGSKYLNLTFCLRLAGVIGLTNLIGFGSSLILY